MSYTVVLPDDARSAGYQETRPFHWEQVFRTADFFGTEEEFLKAGKAYACRQIDQFTRLQVQP